MFGLDIFLVNVLVLITFLDFVGHESIFGNRKIYHNWSSLEDFLVEFLDGLLARPVFGELNKGKSFIAFLVIRVEGYLEIDYLSIRQQQLLQMLFVDIKHDVSDDQSISLAKLLLIA
jgi:hypothetical protein